MTGEAQNDPPAAAVPMLLPPLLQLLDRAVGEDSSISELNPQEYYLFIENLY